MAEGERDATIPKKPRLFEIGAPDDKLKADIRLSLGQLHYDTAHALTLCKIEKSNGDISASFSDAMCTVTLTDECHPFSSFFQAGVRIVEKFISKPGFIKEITDGKKIALSRLFETIYLKKGISQRLKDLKVDGKNETAWVVQLVHHLLTKLSVNQTYMIDHFSKKKLNQCRCCNEEIKGTYGDTSMGNTDVWHGCTDILLGGHAFTNVAVEVAEFPHPDGENVHTSSCEVKDDLAIARHADRMYAKSIIFSFLHKMKPREDVQNFLIPTIRISEKEVIFCFYDADFDVMLRSTKPLSLFDKTNQLNLSTVIALWLTINYPITCSGLTDEVIGTGYKADFFKCFETEIKLIYQNSLQFGACRSRCRNSPDKVFQMNLNPNPKPIKGKYEYLEDSD